jgi:hypothetical protein
VTVKRAGRFLEMVTNMAYETLEVRIVGVSPLLIHNAQLADPMNRFVRAIKEITAKGRKKTDSDLEALSKLEFLGGLYLGDKGVPAIPGECIEGMIRDGAKKSRAGKDAICGIISDGVWPIEYDGPKDPEKLWLDDRFRDYRGVKVGSSRVMRMRPRFNSWAITFSVAYQDEVVNRGNLEKWIRDAGQLVGLCDFRPRFGRFEVESVK